MPRIRVSEPPERILICGSSLLTSHIVGIRRKALKDYTFSNGGQHVSVGEIACVPSWEITHDESKYPNPYEFDGLRFVKSIAFPEQPNNMMRGTTFTDGTKDWPIWGLGSKIW